MAGQYKALPVVVLPNWTGQSRFSGSVTLSEVWRKVCPTVPGSNPSALNGEALRH